MAIQGNFATVFEDIFCSPQAAGNGQFVSQLIIEKLYEKVDLDQLFTVVAPVRTGDPVVAMIQSAVYNAVQNTTATDCAISTCDVSPEYQAKVWAIMLAECRHALCTRGLDEKFLSFWGAYKRANPESDEYDFALNQVAEMLSDLIANTLLAKLWLSDTSLQTVPGTVSGTIDGIDGFLVQVLGDTDRMVDAGDTRLSGEALYQKVSDAIAEYQDSTFGQDMTNVRIYMDRKDANSIIRWLNTEGRNSGANCECIDPDGVVRADRYTLQGFRIHGIEVVAQPFEDMMLAFPQYTEGGEALYHNFVLITRKENMLVGTSNQDDLAYFDQFYDKKDRTFYFDIGYTYGAMIPTNHFSYLIGEKVTG